METTQILPKDIVDRIIIQAEIEQLLQEPEGFENNSTTHPADFLDTRITLEDSDQLSIREAISPTLTAESDIVIEREIMRTCNGKLEVPQVLGSTYSKINIPGMPGDYYIRTSLLRNVMTQFLYENEIRPFNGGDILVAKVYIDTKLLTEMVKNDALKRISK